MEEREFIGEYEQILKNAARRPSDAPAAKIDPIPDLKFRIEILQELEKIR